MMAIVLMRWSLHFYVSFDSFFFLMNTRPATDPLLRRTAAFYSKEEALVGSEERKRTRDTQQLYSS